MEEEAITMVPVNENLMEHRIEKVLTLYELRTKGWQGVEVETLTIVLIIQQMMEEVDTSMEALCLSNNIERIENDEVVIASMSRQTINIKLL